VYKVLARDTTTGMRCVVANNHTIDGQGNRKIPGNRDRFKSQVMQRVLEASTAFASSMSSKGLPPVIAVGDWNMTWPRVESALRAMSGGDWSASKHDGERDFMVANSDVVDVPLPNLVLAWDKQHHAHVAEVRSMASTSPWGRMLFSETATKAAQTIVTWLRQRKQQREERRLALDMALESEAEERQEKRLRLEAAAQDTLRRLHEAQLRAAALEEHCRRVEAVKQRMREEEEERSRQAEAQRLREEEEERRRLAEELERWRQDEEQRRRQEAEKHRLLMETEERLRQSLRQAEEERRLEEAEERLRQEMEAQERLRLEADQQQRVLAQLLAQDHMI